MLALTGCGQSGPTSGEAQSEAGPGIEETYDCDGVRGFYVDAMTTVKNIKLEKKRAKEAGRQWPRGRSEADSIYLAQRAVERMHELGCPRVPKAPR